MPSVDFLQSMISHKPKEIFLKFELLEFNKNTDEFELIDEAIVKERKLPNGVSNVNGGININVEQDIRTTLNLEITNAGGINNWGADFDCDDPHIFKWWLDKRLNLYLGLRLDESGNIEFIQMGHFIITNFKTNHNLTTFPVTQIQGASKETLFTSKKGKFLFPKTICKNVVMTDTIKKLLLDEGEKESNILIDPQINTTSLKLDYGEVLTDWKILRPDVTISLDTIDKIHGDSSIKIEVSSSNKGIIAEKEYLFPVDLSRTNAIALWTRCSKNIPEGGMSLLLIDDSGETRELPFRELVGHVIENDKVLAIDNWRNVILNTDNFNALTKVKKIQLKVNTSIDTPYTLWLDQIYCAEIRNILQNDLTYGAGQNKWQAIKELANLLDCYSYYDEFGHFILQKRKFPKKCYSNNFKYDAYEILQPVITYRDTDIMNNLYAGTDDLFEEYELSNHIQVTGGSTSSSIMTLIDIALYTDGIHIKEKGKLINNRGKIRAIDQFNSCSMPTILNSNTDVEKVYKGHQNLQNVVDEYPNGFPDLEQPPITNFAIEKIGDYIYHHNNANADPLIIYAYEGKNRALWELRKKLAYAEQLNVLSAPYYVLKGHDIIRVEDNLLGLNDNFQIKSINIPFDGNYMSITATKIRNLIIDIPYFNISPLKATACWYGYDGLGLTFTYPF